RQPEGEKLGNRKGSLPAGVDCRGDGGWTVAPGAVFEQWRWEWFGNNSKLSLSPPVPEWILSAIKARKSDEGISANRSTGRSADQREQAYAAKALDNQARDLSAMAPQTGRNERLNIAAFTLGTMVARGWIGEATVTGRLFDACVANGLDK